MKIIESIEEMREYSQQCKRDGKTIASIETEGYLHEGHMTLVKVAQDSEPVTVVTTASMSPLSGWMEWPECYREILIEQESLYVKTSLMEDIELCKAYDVDVFFHPSMLDYYRSPLQTLRISDDISRQLLDNSDTVIIGAFINYAFDLTIKCWNIICPDISMFGEKDIHQAFLMKKMANVLLFPIKVIMVPTVRDSDGLAYSSRNEFLTPSERQDATSIYQTLHEISRWSTYPSVIEIKEHITNRIKKSNGEIDYVQICCPETIEKLKLIDRKAVILVAAYFGNTYLSDNIIIEP